MRYITLVLCLALVGCGYQSASDGDSGTSAADFSDAQKVLDGVASKHTNVKRLTLHAVPAGGECTQIASTMASRRGKPSDPEDLEALSTGKEVVLDEEGAIDVTVPILMKDGKPTAVAGVTLAMAEGADREKLIGEARAIAQELAQGISAADKPLW